MTPEVLIVAAIAILGWLIKISWSQWSLKRNHLSELLERMARLEEQMKAAQEDIRSLFDKMDKR